MTVELTSEGLWLFVVSRRSGVDGGADAGRRPWKKPEVRAIIKIRVPTTNRPTRCVEMWMCFTSVIQIARNRVLAQLGFFRHYVAAAAVCKR